jgi:hypothetical protein
MNARVDETGDHREQPDELTSELTSSSPGLATTPTPGPTAQVLREGRVHDLAIVANYTRL